MPVTLATPVNEIELVPGSAIRLKNLTWSGYMAVLQTLGDQRATRVTFDNGILEIRMPGQLHETINRVLATIILTLAEILDLEFNDLGSSRLNRPDLVKGIEPDSCFYIQNAQDGQGLVADTTISPDLAIEVDIASSSASKLAIYQALGVREIWLYQQNYLQIQVLNAEGKYEDRRNSEAFPQVTVELINKWLEVRKSGTDLAVIRAVQADLQSEQE